MWENLSNGGEWLLHPVFVVLIMLSDLLVSIIPSKVVQDLLLQLQALMADESFFFRVAGHAAQVLAHTIRYQVGLVAVERGATLCWLYLLGHGNEEFFGRHQRVREVRV